MALYGKERVLTGKGVVFINDVPFAYTENFQLSATQEKESLTRSHDLTPDREIITSATVEGSFDTRQYLLETLEFWGFITDSENHLQTAVLNSITDGAGDITFPGVVPTGYSPRDPVFVLDSSFNFHTVSPTVSGSDLTLSGLPADEKIRAYVIFVSDTAQPIYAYKPNALPPEATIVVHLYGHPSGADLLVKIPRATLRDWSISGLGDPFTPQTVNFTALNDTKGAAFYVQKLDI